MALLPWLNYAAASLDKYSSIRKSCVFCFEAFLCRVACADKTVVTARHLLPHLKNALQREIQLRGTGSKDQMTDESCDGEVLCDVMSLGVASSVDGVECCNCKRLCHFSYFASSSSHPETFCSNCVASVPSQSPLSLIERVNAPP
jgi:hypothetical protein